MDKDDDSGPDGLTPTRYQVGHKKPPKHTQFQKGTSGNPKGRPRKSRTWGAMVREAFATPQSVPQPNGRRKKLPTDLVIVLQLINDALRGDKMARKLALQLRQAVDDALASDRRTPEEIVQAAKAEEAYQAKAKALAQDYHDWLEAKAAANKPERDRPGSHASLLRAYENALVAGQAEAAAEAKARLLAALQQPESRPRG